MILRLLKRLLNNTLYVIVRENSFTLMDPNMEKRQDYQSVEPFSSARLAISNFQRAESFLKTSVNDFYSKGIISPSPKMIMHQVHRNEGGLGQVEMRVLREVAFSAGAREVFIWQGSELTKEELVSESYV